MRERTKILWALLLIIIIAITVYFSIIAVVLLTSKPIVPNTQIPTPTPTPTVNVQVSGIVDIKGLWVQPTEVQFINTVTHVIYKAPINSQLFYNISLPNNQSYGIVGDWNGRTFNDTGIPMGAIDMGIFNLNANVTSITQNLPIIMTDPNLEGK